MSLVLKHCTVHCRSGIPQSRGDTRSRSFASRLSPRTPIGQQTQSIVRVSRVLRYRQVYAACVVRCVPGCVSVCVCVCVCVASLGMSVCVCVCAASLSMSVCVCVWCVCAASLDCASGLCGTGYVTRSVLLDASYIAFVSLHKAMGTASLNEFVDAVSSLIAVRPQFDTVHHTTGYVSPGFAAWT